jgi:hypothetical protein
VHVSDRQPNWYRYRWCDRLVDVAIDPTVLVLLRTLTSDCMTT